MMKGKLCAVYFSATETTRRTIAAICSGLGSDCDVDINLADDFDVRFPEFEADDVVIIAAPVYGGRIPVPAAEVFKRLVGNGAKAVPVVVFGNRAYDDALLELTDIVRAAGFRSVAAAAAIGCHSIFPKVATGRPDAADVEALRSFGQQVAERIEADLCGELIVNGKRPYKDYSGLGMCPTVIAEECGKCGECAAKCPMGAIDKENPQITNKKLCISCGRCIHVCRRQARHFSGVKYKMVGAIFVPAFSARKDPEFIFPQSPVQ